MCGRVLDARAWHCKKDTLLPCQTRGGPCSTVAAGVSLTTAGEYVLVYAKRVLATLKAAEDAMTQPALRELERHPFIGREPGSGTRKAMGDFFRAQQISPHLTMEMSSNETIKQAVMAGMGLGFLSLHTMGLELRSGLLQILHVDNTPIMRTWNIVHLLSKILSPAAEAFRYFVLERGEEMLRAHAESLLPASS